MNGSNSKSVRGKYTKAILITQPVEWIAEWRISAEEEGMTLSEWVGDACLSRIPASRRLKLPTRRPPGRRPNAGVK